MFLWGLPYLLKCWNKVEMFDVWGRRELEQSNTQKRVQVAATFPEMRRLDENGESWQQGSKGELVVQTTHKSQEASSWVCGLHNSLLGRGWDREQMFKALCCSPCSQGHRVACGGVPRVGWVGRGLLLTLGTDRFGKQMLFRSSWNSLVMQGTFQQRYQWCTGPSCWLHCLQQHHAPPRKFHREDKSNSKIKHCNWNN